MSSAHAYVPLPYSVAVGASVGPPLLLPHVGAADAVAAVAASTMAAARRVRAMLCPRVEGGGAGALVQRRAESKNK